MSELWKYDPNMSRPDAPIADFDVVAQDTSIGTVDLAVHDDDVEFLVVRTGGLLTRHQVVIPAGLVQQVNVDQQKIFLRVDHAIVEDAPEYAEDWRSDPTWRERTTAHFPVD